MKYCYFLFLVNLLIVSCQNSTNTTTIDFSPPSPPSVTSFSPLSPLIENSTTFNNTNTTNSEESDVFPVTWIWGASGALLFVLLLYTAPRILSVSVEEVSDEK